MAIGALSLLELLPDIGELAIELIWTYQEERADETQRFGAFARATVLPRDPDQPPGVRSLRSEQDPG
jgi:hypothetical protein